MCTIEDAKRYEKLGQIEEKNGDHSDARRSYLEATSIYVLQAQVQGKRSFIDDANRCYAKASLCIGKKVTPYSKQELAKRSLDELGEIETDIGEIHV